MRPASESTLQRDIQCFIRTYCHSRHTTAVLEESFDCPLVELNLIAELPESDNGYEFQRGEKETLPVEMFAATLSGLCGLPVSPNRDTNYHSQNWCTRH